jgi:hypothetical protein
VVVTERLIRDGRVAVLYSPGYGAGWSTWCLEDEQMRLSMLFDPQIADIRDRGDADWEEKVRAIALVKYPEAYTGGLADLEVRWLPVGTQFCVREYDGHESIEINSEIEWITA